MGGSVYLVDSEHSFEFEELPKEFEGPELRWYEFRVEGSVVERNARPCTLSSELNGDSLNMPSHLN